MYKRDTNMINDRLKADYDLLKEQGYEVMAVMLQGSQNYNLDYEGSDIDTKAIVLPSFDDIVAGGKMVSEVIILDTDEHMDVKDVRLMFGNFLKQNINFLEILFSTYSHINPLYQRYMNVLIDNKEKIARHDNYKGMNCAVGMTYQKYKALEHPYPATASKIEEFGYDGKQLHHMLRLDEFMERFFENGEPFQDCLISRNAEELVLVKKNEKYTLEEARKLAEQTNIKAHERKEKYGKENPQVIDDEVPVLLDGLVKDMIRDHLTRELITENFEEQLKLVGGLEWIIL